jgi:hypothetical protein
LTFVSQAIADTGLGYLWLGGGDTDVKLRVALHEWIAKTTVPVLVSDLSLPKTDYATDVSAL